jgi:hypothetical protein
MQRTIKTTNTLDKNSETLKRRGTHRKKSKAQRRSELVKRRSESFDRVARQRVIVNAQTQQLHAALDMAGNRRGKEQKGRVERETTVHVAVLGRGGGGRRRRGRERGGGTRQVTIDRDFKDAARRVADEHNASGHVTLRAQKTVSAEARSGQNNVQQKEEHADSEYRIK